MSARYRSFQPVDTDGLLSLWDQARSSGFEPVYSLAEVLASCNQDHAVVAYESSSIIGVAVGRVAHEQGWVVLLVVDEAYRGLGIGGRLLGELEIDMARSGITKLSMLVADDGKSGVLEKAGFQDLKHLKYFEREVSVSERERELLQTLGGRVLARDLWGKIAGMKKEKELLERRLVLPLSDAKLAEAFGVEPPKAIVLFGPPGTGKTTFAKAVASRLDWPFIEVFPSRLAGDPNGVAGGLRDVFTAVDELENVVVFIDEVEEIASKRKGDPPSPTQGVTNELLKLIPNFREKPGHLLVVATNYIRALDDAFLRHGRFDYVIPIGLPDAEARRSIWTRYIPALALDRINLDELVARTSGFSPADIEYAARKASQRALEQSVFESDAVTRESSTTTTEHYLWAIGDTRRTVSDDVIEEFEVDIERLGRL
jgi:AAA+ superfamily predicted ATPase/N-acetylglutamate synthase-like GNAT family acetyltransferase